MRSTPASRPRCGAVAEGPLTGPTGGGFLLAWFDGEATVLDCFFAAPSRPLGEMEEIVIDFGDASTQVFHVGAGSVAVPGLVAGLEEAHRRFGSMPWPSSSSPRSSSPAPGSTRPRSRVPPHDPPGILERDEGGRRIYGTSGRVETERVRRDARAGPGPRLGALAELLPELAGDLARYKVASAEPLAPRSAGSRPHHAGAFARRGRRRCRARAARRRRDARRQSGGAPSRLRGGAAARRSRARRRSPSSTPTATRPRSPRRSAPAPGLSRRHAAEQHARRARRGGRRAQVPGARLAEHDDADARARGRPAAARARQRRLGPSAPARSCRSRTPSSRGTPVAEAIERRACTSTATTFTSKAAGRWHVALEADWMPCRWAGRNLFFGGVSAVERAPTARSRPPATLAAAAHGVVVE